MLPSKATSIVRPGHNWSILDQYADSLQSDYLANWATALRTAATGTAGKMPSAEATARLLTAHLLEQGCSEKFVHRWLTYHVKYDQTTYTLADLVDAANERLNTGVKTIDVLVPLALVADGWRHLRFSVPHRGEILDGRQSMRDGIELFHSVRDATGDDVELILDVHTRLDPPEAVTLCREIESARPYFVEDPLRCEGVDSYRMLRARTSVPLAAGEQFGSKWEFKPLVEGDLIDYARVDIAVAAGITEAKKIAGWCEAHYIKLATHNPLGPVTAASSVHLNLSSPYVGLQEHQADPEPEIAALFTARPVVTPGRVERPTQPGLGVDIDRAAARRYSAVSDERPHLRTPDGAFTNW